MTISPVSGLQAAKRIVSPTAGQGNYTTIQAAITAASSGETILIKPGTFTENLTLKAGVNLTAYGCDQYNNVIIVGKATFTAAGTVALSGIQLKTTSDFALAVTGSAASIVRLTNCFLNANNNTGISFTVANTASEIDFYNCMTDIQTTGIALYSMSSTGNLRFYSSVLNNTGASTTASSNSAGAVTILNTPAAFPISTSSGANLTIYNSDIDTSAINSTAVTTAGTGQANIFDCFISTGTASSLSFGTGTTGVVSTCNIGSSNTNAITGAGTINYAGLTFSGSSKLINTNTQTGGLLQGGLTQAPSAGFIGELFTNTGTNVSLSNGTPKTVASISPTAGVWDISATFTAANSGNAITGAVFSINTTNNANSGAEGDTQITMSPLVTMQFVGVSIAPVRAILTTTTTYYAVIQENAGAGSLLGNARIRAVRVG